MTKATRRGKDIPDKFMNEVIKRKKCVLYFEENQNAPSCHLFFKMDTYCKYRQTFRQINSRQKIFCLYVLFIIYFGCFILKATHIVKKIFNTLITKQQLNVPNPFPYLFFRISQHH